MKLFLQEIFRSTWHCSKVLFCIAKHRTNHLKPIQDTYFWKLRINANTFRRSRNIFFNSPRQCKFQTNKTIQTYLYEARYTTSWRFIIMSDDKKLRYGGTLMDVSIHCICQTHTDFFWQDLMLNCISMKVK